MYNFNLANREFIDLNQYILQFADDTALVCHEKNLQKTIESLQNATDKITTWFIDWRVIK